MALAFAEPAETLRLPPVVSGPTAAGRSASEPSSMPRSCASIARLSERVRVMSESRM